MRNVIGMISVVAFLITAPASAQSVPVEENAVIADTKDFPRSVLLGLVDPGVQLIRLNGWRCDSISAILPFLFSRGFSLTCNRFSYKYEFTDRGGNWVVKLK